MNKLELATLAVVAISASHVARASVQYGSPSVLQPAKYSSPSGEYELFVEPSDRLGRGPGRYLLTRRGAEVWSGEKPFTFWRAVVSDDGVAAGYAYTSGEDGWGEDDELVVAILSMTGAPMREERVPRAPCEMHAPPAPLGVGIFVQPAIDQLVVRVKDREFQDEGEAWWSYRLSTGEALAKLRPRILLPDPAPVRWCNGARPVAGTPLVLSHWWQYDSGVRRAEGGTFALVDSAARPVWTLPLPGDYTIEGDEASERSLLWEIRDGGALLDTDTAGSFEIRHVREKARVRYSIVADRERERGWRVEEIGSAPYEPPKSSQELLAAIALAPLGATPLRAENTARGAIRDVLAFDIDGENRIEFVRGEDAIATFTIVSLDAGGAVERETPFRVTDSTFAGWGEWARLADGSWLLIGVPADDDERAKAWRVDRASGACTELTDFRGPDADEVDPSPNGGFVVVATYDYAYSLQGAVRAFDAAGRLLWERREARFEHDEGPSALQSPEDLAVLPDGTVAVLEQSADRLHLFAPDGTHRRSIELADAWGQEPNYVSGATADGDGVLIHDFQGDPPLWRMELDGKVRSRLTPRFPDARSPVQLATCARVAPDGRIWTTDGSCFIRLGDDGVVDRVVGSAPDATALTKAEATAIDGLGRILVQDGRTGAVHVFGPDGVRRFVCRPGPADFPSTSSIDELVAHGDGGVLAELSKDRYSYVRFGPDGSRVGTLELGDVVTCARGSSEIWAVRNDELGRISASGEVLRRVPRRADGKWFESVDGVAAGPDGSVAVLDVRGRFGFLGPPVVALFAADGSPMRVFEVPTRVEFSRIAHGGRWIVLSRWGSDVVLVDTKDGSTHAFDVPGMSEVNSSWRAGFSPDGSELWMLQSPELLLHRFRIP